ncbi:general transcription factor 3C polypeptide 4 [Stigmatopora nigra]
MASPVEHLSSVITNIRPSNDITEMDFQATDNVVNAEDLPVKRDPAITLLSTPSGTQPLVWSQDHRLAVCTSNCVVVVEHLCDFQTSKQDLILSRSSIPIADKSYKMRVGPSTEHAEAMTYFNTHSDYSTMQEFLLDRAMNPYGEQKGMKYASWSPLGCGGSGRCLLACLTLENRLTIQQCHVRLGWQTMVDLGEKYGELLQKRGYAQKDGQPPEKDLLDFEELQRRHRMQTPVRMEWSSIYTLKQVQSDNSCLDVEMVLLAVLMENGDLILWKFTIPFENESDVVFFDAIESWVSRPSALAWWEYENAGRQMSGLIVGSDLGPIKIMPVSLIGVKGYFTLRHPVILWEEIDKISVENLKCVSLVHPVLQSTCSLIVASRGSYVFWCLLAIKPTGLEVRNSHIAGLYSLPVVSLAVGSSGVVYTCSANGWIKKLMPKFTENALIFDQKILLSPENLTNQRLDAIALSSNEAYIALLGTRGMVNSFHANIKNYQVNFFALKLPEVAAELLLGSPSEKLYKQADLLDIMRWNILKTKNIPEELQQELDQKIQETDSLYFWRLKLFLLRFLHQSLQSPLTDHQWKPSKEIPHAVVRLDQEKDEEEGEEMKGNNSNEQMTDLQEKMDLVEKRLARENMKKLLGEVYLNSPKTEKTRIPTLGVAEHLLKESGDENTEVLIGHIKKKMNKQTFPECCSICQETLPFTDHKQALCQNGHTWLRCVLSYQACQTFTYRRCLLHDSVSGIPDPDDPQWIKKILQAPCLLCDSPMM